MSAPEIRWDPRGWWEVGDWTFDADEDADITYIDEAIAAWTAWRNIVAEGEHRIHA